MTFIVIGVAQSGDVEIMYPDDFPQEMLDKLNSYETAVVYNQNTMVLPAATAKFPSFIACHCRRVIHSYGRNMGESYVREYNVAAAHFAMEGADPRYTLSRRVNVNATYSKKREP